MLISERFGTTNITCMLEWIQENDVSYNVSIEPQVALDFIGNTGVQFVVLYNTLYSASVVADNLCNSANTTVEFNYSEFCCL